MYAALGVHPSESAELSDAGLKQIEAWCTEKNDGKVRAIGEIGLDYYWEEPDKEIQKKWFRKILSDFAGYYECGIYGSTRTA